MESAQHNVWYLVGNKLIVAAADPNSTFLEFVKWTVTITRTGLQVETPGNLPWMGRPEILWELLKHLFQI